MGYEIASTAENVFEVHVGFPTRLLHLWDKLHLSEPDAWSVLTATEIIVLPGMQCFDAHEVPETLGKLVTKRVATAKEAYAEVDRLARFFSLNSDIRIEMEQVLMTQKTAEQEEWIVPTEFVPDQVDLKYAEIISETPPFEAHLIVEGLSITNKSYHPVDIVRLAEGIGVLVHQTVCFETVRLEKRVILTRFFSSYEELVEDVTRYGYELREALRMLDSSLHLRIVAERIILCAKPSNLPSPRGA